MSSPFRYAYEEKDVVVLVKELEDSPMKWYLILNNYYYVAAQFSTRAWISICTSFALCTCSGI